jgi:sarcosine oxidase
MLDFSTWNGPMTYDVIVIGLGGMGSAAAAALERRGASVLGLEQYPLVHRRGSSHGHTRIIRTAYYEHPAYVPLVRRAFTLWRELEQRTGRRLLTDCPCLNLGPSDGELIRGVRASAKEHALTMEELTTHEITERYPQFRLPEGTAGVLEHAAGYLRVEECVRAHQEDAAATGYVEFRAEEQVVGWKVVGNAVEVRSRTNTFSAGKLIVTAGAWAKALLTELSVPLTVMRQVQLWFTPPSSPHRFDPERFPIFILDSADGAYYGLPMIEQNGVKCARHYGAPELADPSGVDWTVTPTDVEPVSNFMKRHLPGAAGPVTRGEVCLYTLTPDRHFVIDRHPHHPNVSFACGFSGHGFKFAPTVGEILADLTLTGTTSHPIDLFRASRFQPSSGHGS